MPTLVDTSLFQRYREARATFLRELGCGDSCRDPLAEFSERLVAQQLNSRLADSRVQKGFDLITPNDLKVQVKYLANPQGAWRNEHGVVFTPGVDLYALVIIEALEVIAIVVFSRTTIAEVCRALNKRHPNQEFSLAFTRKNFHQILAEEERFAQLGVTCFTLSQQHIQKTEVS